MYALAKGARTTVALVQVLLTAARPIPRSPDDSLRTIRDARSAQASFEAFRRSRLPVDVGASGPCDIRVGRYCYWRNDESSDRPAEPRVIQDRRADLLHFLDSVARLYPGDEWLAGQNVRYLVEAGRIDDAIRYAGRCGAERYWCMALRGYAAHVGARFPLADSAYAASLVAMPSAERCRWLDVSEGLADDLAGRFKSLSCDAREAFLRRAAFIGAPLYLVSSTDLFTEQLARVTRARMAEHSANPYGMSWASDQRSLVLRYGWPAWYTRTAPDVWSETQQSIVGHDAGMAYYFLPSARGLDTPDQIDAADWKLDDPRALSGYTPSYARTLEELPAQIAAFRRGESTLVVAAWDASRDTTLVGRDLVSALVLATQNRVIAMTVDSAAKGRGVASVIGLAGSGLISMEVLAREERRAGRSRIGFRAPLANTLSVSDLLLYRSDAKSVSALEQVRDSALTGNELPLSRAVGVYWETYGLPRSGEPLHYSLSVERQGGGWLRRAAERLHLADPASTLRIQWDEVPERSANGVAGRGVRVDLSRLHAGRYDMRLTVTAAAGATVTSMREIEVP